MRKDKSPRPLELLAPARDVTTARAAILHGADAIYMGGPGHGARAAAANSIEEIAEAVEFARRYDVRVYVTVNTLVYDSEIAEVERMIRSLYRIGVDALIVQDLGILAMDIPPIALHASTQCDARTPEKARWLEDLGFSQIVLPREFSADEIRQVRDIVDIPLEVFVHGALCVSFSGDCQASFLATGRSANRGECSQMCRLSYDLVDGNGEKIVKGKHLLSLRDMNRLSSLEELAAAGASSFKIEGRLKDEAYVKNVTAAYSSALDRLVALYPDRYRRASLGRARPSFVPDVARSFNRGFTDYFLHGVDRKVRMASAESPKHIGMPVGDVKSVKKGRIYIDLRPGVELVAGDGLCFFRHDGSIAGFRVNRVDGSSVVPSLGADLPEAGTSLRRNNDIMWEKSLKAAGERRIDINAHLYLTTSGYLTLTFGIPGGVSASAAVPMNDRQEARSPQKDVRRAAVAKLGDTPYALSEWKDDVADDVFIPAGLLTGLRRKAVEALESGRRASYKYDYRRPAADVVKAPFIAATYHDNVANSLAEKVYSGSGVKVKEKALEVAAPPTGETWVMTTRYCIRRELGACLREKSGSRMKAPLCLIHGNSRWRLDFDCARCRMEVIANPAGES